MAAETQYTANTGLVKISTANSNLDGTGTLGTVITGASNGTLIKNVIIKATDTGSGSTSQGMVRLFIYDGSSTLLLKEVDIPAMGQSSTDATFETVIPLNFKLESGHVLKASTQNATGFNVIAEGLDFAYYASSVRPESTNYTANTGAATITTQNTALDGSGTLATLVTAGASGSGWKGLAINSISLKAYTDVTRGMLKLFIQNTGTGASNTFCLLKFLFPVDASATFQSYHWVIPFLVRFRLRPVIKFAATIESTAGQNVSGVVDAMDWKYPA
ncbi:MAG: hypothetical protein IPM74_02090 [Crocinitomicaceae bacterium]|nr:hypothetical protein [Crocinitomicaceae bacterium]